MFLLVLVSHDSSAFRPRVGTTSSRATLGCVGVNDGDDDAGLEFRDIEIFLTLAEELHFGRTAERLHISPPREPDDREAGTANRCGPVRAHQPQGDPDPDGAQLRDDLQAGYQRIQDGTDAAKAAARGVGGSLAIGTMGALAHEIADVIGLFKTRNPTCELQFREIRTSDPFGSPARR